MPESRFRSARAVDIADNIGNGSLVAPGIPMPSKLPWTEAMSSSSNVSTSRSWQSSFSTSFCSVGLQEN